MAAPSWLDREFLQDVVRSSVGDDSVLLTQHEVSSVVGVGENYMSQLHGARVEISRGDEPPASRYFIIKCMPPSREMQEMVATVGAMRKELYTYQYVLPTMYEIVKEKTSQDCVPISAESYPSPQPKVLILQDLKQDGYKMADRLEQLDLLHCKVALKMLARFHAMSAVLYEKNPDFIVQYTEPMFSEERRELANMCVQDAVMILSESVKSWPGYERFSAKLHDMAEQCIDRMIELLQVRPGSLRVLNHADYWTNNIMFKYCETTGQVIDAKIIDFQMCRFGSPALDVQFFLYTSPRQDVREGSEGELLRDYHATLCDTLRTLGCAQLVRTFEHFQEEMEYYSYFGLLTASTILTLILARPTSAGPPAEMIRKGIAGDSFQKVFKPLLLHFEDRGLL